MFHDDFKDIETNPSQDLLILDKNSKYYLKDHPTKKGVGNNSDVK